MARRHYPCVDEAENGLAAVNAFQNRESGYDIIFMDIQMPEMDGVEATIEIKKMLHENCPPIVAMTAYSMKDDCEKFIQQGLDDYISKPVRPEELARVLDTLLADAEQSVEAGGAPPQEISPPVEMERLYLAVGEDPEEVSDILCVYLGQMTESLERLDAAIESGDAGQVDLIAHNCAGVSATCGVVAVVGPLRELERMGRDDQLAGAPALLVRVGSEFERVRLFLRESLEQAVS